MSPALKLTYFDVAGRAELARLLFTFGGVAFEDTRVSGPEFGAMKVSLPLGQLPILEVDGVVFSQSMAISRYAAKVAGLYPADAVQALRVEMISETLLELATTASTIIYLTKDEAVKAEKTTKLLNETLPKSLAALEAMMQGKFFMGENATLADVQLFELVQYSLKSFSGFDLSKYPKLEGVVEVVKSNANITAYLAKP
uniref:Glutathione S-transferase n=1 Tax=Globisporangium ultimum (strain ATCC 200006 / CBS 805.95 / DAOM BR144) TaxID=431595 RepID=K3WK10_GLOUD